MVRVCVLLLSYQGKRRKLITDLTKIPNKFDFSSMKFSLDYATFPVDINLPVQDRRPMGILDDSQLKVNIHISIST